MKYTFLTAGFLLSVSMSAQESTTISVYENGIKTLNTISIEKNILGETVIYENKNGIKPLSPSIIIEPDGEGYSVENGIKSVTPIFKIEEIEGN